MEDNYFWFVNGKGFVRYMDALEYAKQITLSERKYYAIFSKNEIAAMHVEECPAVDGFGCHCDDVINHESECGK
jgi:hypothetical protein